MANTSFVQTNFQFGMWSERAQGNMTDERYKAAMAESLNGYPVEEKSWSKRPGFADGGYTRAGKDARIEPLSVNARYDFDLEFTDGFIRFWQGPTLLTEGLRVNVTAVNAGSPAQVTVNAAVPWANNDEVMFRVDTASNAGDAGPLTGRTFFIQVSDNKHFTITDSVTGQPFDGSAFILGNNQVSVARVVNVPTPYVNRAMWSIVNITQRGGQYILFHPNVPPHYLQGDDKNPGGWVLIPGIFRDGPYLDVIQGVQLTAKGTRLALNHTFQNWDSEKTYAKYDMVFDGGSVFVSKVGSNTANDPPTSPSQWYDTGMINVTNGGNGQVFTTGNWNATHTYNQFDVAAVARVLYISTRNGNVNLDPRKGTGWRRATNVVTTPGKANTTVDMQFYIPTWDADQVYPGDGFGGAYNERYIVRWKGQIYRTLISGNKGNQPDVSPLQWKLTTKWEYVNGGKGMTSADIGRFIRVYNEPNPWNPDTSYQQNDHVSWFGTYWVALTANTNAQPGQDATNWAAAPASLAKWTWGTIAQINPSSAADFQVVFPEPLWYLGRITNWRLGRYFGTTQPSTGCFYEGRLWLSGTAGQFDASVALDFTRFSPSTWFNAVQDDSAISETLDAESTQAILWFRPTSKGLLLGTVDGEWKVEASAQDDVITATSIQARNESIFGSAQIDPILAGVVPVFVHRNGKLILESLRDTYSDQMISLNLLEMAKSLAESGIIKICYTRMAIAPFIWAVCNNGELIGTTYRRDKLRMFTVEPPQLNGWHHHRHGHPSRVFTWCAPYKSMHNNGDGLAVVTNDVDTGRHRVEFMRDQMGETDDVYLSNYLDGSTITTATQASGKTIIVTTTPGVPAHWEMPGYTLVTQCALDGVQFDLSIEAQSGNLTAQQLIAQLVKNVFNSGPANMPFINDAGVWVSPPSSGGGGGCGFFIFTQNGEWPGMGNSQYPVGPDGNGNVTIWYASGDTSFGTTKWFPYQYWKAIPGANLPATQPVYHAEIPPTTTITESDVPATGLSFTGLSRYDGTLVRVFLCGLDLGELPVIGGTLTVPFGTVPEFTRERVQQVDAFHRDWKDLAINFSGYNIPGLIGYYYDSRGQLLTPFTPAETGAQAGPGFAKKKRGHKYGIKVSRSQTMSIGTDFTMMYPVALTFDDGLPIPPTYLYSGIAKDTLGDDSRLEFQLAWESTGPYPLNVTAAGAFLETQDE